MKEHDRKTRRLLCLALSSRGFGYAVLEGETFLVECGRTSAKGDKNRACLAKAERLIGFYKPDTIVLQDVVERSSHRALRIKSLSQQIVKTARKRKLKVAIITGNELRKLILGDINGTKQEMAEMVMKRFSAELAWRLPPKRKTWESADGRMDIFDAVGLAVAFRMMQHGMTTAVSDDGAIK